MAKCKALTGSAVKGLTKMAVHVLLNLVTHYSIQ